MRTYDAGIERETLARDLADWKAAGYIHVDRARRWHRRVRLHAKMCGMTVERVTADLNADADLICEDD